MLYDLKFSFKPYLKFKDERIGAPRKAYEALCKLDCSQNKIQFIEGMDLLPNLRQLSLRDNELCLTRHTINQLFLLQRLQSLQL
jgi:Leucine-rich repeat (LRR) protein